MERRVLRLSIITALFLSQMFVAPEAAFAEFTPSNHQAASLVLGQANFTSSIAITTQTGMKNPYGVAADPLTSKVFVADQNNHRVLRFTSAMALTNGEAAEVVLGQANFTSGLANRGGTVDANTMSNPYGVFVDTGGRLWVVDMLNNRVLRFNNASAKENGANADGVLGQPDFTSSTHATTQSGMYNPAGLFVDLEGRLWVSELSNHRVLRFDNAAAKDDGGNADRVLGQLDFDSNAYETTQSGMYYPTSVYVDPGGRLWVSESLNNRVLRFDNAAAKDNGADADGVLGQADFTSKDSDCTQSRMHSPRGVSGDNDGRLYVADGSNNRVIIFEGAAGLGNGVNANNVLGQTDFSTCTANTDGISAASLDTPTRVFFDTSTNVLWVADMINNRVLMYGTPQISIYLPVVKKEGS